MTTAVAPRRRRRLRVRVETTKPTHEVELDDEQIVRWTWWLAAHGWPKEWT